METEEFYKLIEKGNELSLEELLKLMIAAKYEENGYEILCDVLYKKLKSEKNESSK